MAGSAPASRVLVADVAIDFVWAHPSVSKSDQPDLNRPAAQLVGRVLVVAEAIEGGRGKVRVGDTLWPAEGPDVPAGTEVRVMAAKGTVLVVERALDPVFHRTRKSRQQLCGDPTADCLPSDSLRKCGGRDGYAGGMREQLL